jgi:hypothetical protein
VLTYTPPPHPDDPSGSGIAKPSDAGGTPNPKPGTPNPFRLGTNRLQVFLTGFEDVDRQIDFVGSGTIPVAPHASPIAVAEGLMYTDKEPNTLAFFIDNDDGDYIFDSSQDPSEQEHVKLRVKRALNVCFSPNADDTVISTTLSKHKLRPSGTLRELAIVNTLVTDDTLLQDTAESLQRDAEQGAGGVVAASFDPSAELFQVDFAGESFPDVLRAAGSFNGADGAFAGALIPPRNAQGLRVADPVREPLAFGWYHFLLNTFAGHHLLEAIREDRSAQAETTTLTVIDSGYGVNANKAGTGIPRGRLSINPQNRLGRLRFFAHTSKDVSIPLPNREPSYSEDARLDDLTGVAGTEDKHAPFGHGTSVLYVAVGNGREDVILGTGKHVTGVHVSQVYSKRGLIPGARIQGAGIPTNTSSLSRVLLALTGEGKFTAEADDGGPTADVVNMSLGGVYTFPNDTAQLDESTIKQPSGLAGLQLHVERVLDNLSKKGTVVVLAAGPGGHTHRVDARLVFPAGASPIRGFRGISKVLDAPADHSTLRSKKQIEVSSPLVLAISGSGIKPTTDTPAGQEEFIFPPLSFGSRVSVCAAGGMATTDDKGLIKAGVSVGLQTVVSHGNNGTLFGSSGSSIASPQVAGTVNEMILLDKILGRSHATSTEKLNRRVRLIEMLEATADTVRETYQELQSPEEGKRDVHLRPNDRMGFGRINVWKALLAVANNGISRENGKSLALQGLDDPMFRNLQPLLFNQAMRAIRFGEVDANDIEREPDPTNPNVQAPVGLAPAFRAAEVDLGIRVREVLSDVENNRAIITTFPEDFAGEKKDRVKSADQWRTVLDPFPHLRPRIDESATQYYGIDIKTQVRGAIVGIEQGGTLAAARDEDNPGSLIAGKSVVTTDQGIRSGNLIPQGVDVVTHEAHPGHVQGYAANGIFAARFTARAERIRGGHLVLGIQDPEVPGLFPSLPFYELSLATEHLVRMRDPAQDGDNVDFDDFVFSINIPICTMSVSETDADRFAVFRRLDMIPNSKAPVQVQVQKIGPKRALIEISNNANGSIQVLDSGGAMQINSLNFTTDEGRFDILRGGPLDGIPEIKISIDADGGGFDRADELIILRIRIFGP